MLRPFLQNETPMSWRSLSARSRRWASRAWHAAESPKQLPPWKQRTVDSSTARLIDPFIGHCRCIHGRPSESNPGAIDLQVPQFEESFPTLASSEQDVLGSRGDTEAMDEEIQKEQRINLRQDLLESLRDSDPARVLDVATTAFRDPELVASLPQTTIAQVFDTLDFGELLRQHKEISQVLSPSAIEKAEEAGWPVRPISTVINSLHSSFRLFFSEWIENGYDIDLKMCKSFLRMSSTTGNARSARWLRSHPKLRGIQWDTEAYNLYLEAICWENAYHELESRSLRVTQPNLSIRSMEAKKSIPGFSGYTTKVSDEAVDVFEEMVSKGFTADCHTYTLLMLSMGRVGDLRRVESTLKRVWGIDVSNVIEGETTQLYFQDDMQQGSPLFPSQDLLFVIAHIYGMNNNLSGALKLVDYISQKYSIPIDVKTWEEILRWTFILSTSRGGEVTRSTQKAQLQQALSVGKVSNATFLKLIWNMRSPRYNIEPNLQMFNWLFASLFRRGEIINMAQLLRTTQQRFALAEPGARLRDSSGTYLPLEKVMDRDEIENLDILACSTMFTRWVRLTLNVNNQLARSRSVNERWYNFVFVPNFIAEWGNLWFQNTHRAFTYRTISKSRLFFDRRMKDENLSQVEIFSTPQKGRYIVRPYDPSYRLSFQEKTYGERRQGRYDKKVETGMPLNYEPSTAWYEAKDVRDWIWLAPGKGVSVTGGRFERSSRNFTLTPAAFDSLDHEQASEIRERLGSQQDQVGI